MKNYTKSTYMKKFISDDELKEEIEKMTSLLDIKAMKEIFPKESLKIKEEGIELGIEKGMEEGMEKGKLEEKIKTTEKMKKEKLDTTTIAKITGINIKEIEKL